MHKFKVEWVGIWKGKLQNGNKYPQRKYRKQSILTIGAEEEKPIAYTEK
jgi:hypothetical protein